MHILGVKIDNVAKNEALAKTQAFLRSPGQHLVFTPNPEMLVAAQRDTYFQEVLNQGDLNLCDGKGVQLFASEPLQRIPGVDFMLDLCELAAQEKKTVYLLGSGSTEVVEACQHKLQEKFPQLSIVGTHRGIEIRTSPQGQLQYDTEAQDALLEHIILTSPDILFVAFGHGKQEKWMYQTVPELPSVKIAMGVGGAFDYISGKIKRAPRWMQAAGFEWLYRLVQEPHRLKRIWTATVVFVFLAFCEKIKNSTLT